MNTSQTISPQFFELFPYSKSAKGQGRLIPYGRTILGRSPTCDIVFLVEGVSSIHAVIELNENSAIIYDMNSTNGTYVNGERISKHNLKIGDQVQIANLYFIFKLYAKEDLPQPLEGLDPTLGKAIPPVPKILPAGPDEIVLVAPGKANPLILDPKAELSEYIFEDAESVFPILVERLDKMTAEIMIFDGETIFAVDYLPLRDGIYYLVGKVEQDFEIEFPVLPKDARIPLLELRSGEIFIYQQKELKLSFLSEMKTTGQSVLKLDRQDIAYIQKDNLKIYLRHHTAPPELKSPPFFFKENNLALSYFVTGLFTLALFILTFTYPVDLTLEEEKIPARLATILSKSNQLLIPQVAVNSKVGKGLVIPEVNFKKSLVIKDDAKNLRNQLLKETSKFKDCAVNDISHKDQDLFSGVVELSFSVGASGHVLDYQITGDFSSDTKACIGRVLEGISFFERADRGTVYMKQTLNFFVK